eukprot:gene8816-1181_t
MAGTDDDEMYKQLLAKGHTTVYAQAYVAKVHEGELFAHHFAVLRERRAKSKGELPSEPQQQETTEPRKRKPEDFIISKRLGQGSYSSVFLCTEKETGQEFAIKILEKLHIQKERKEKYVLTERDVFNALRSPFIVQLYYTFQDTARLYFVIEYCKNGELLDWLQKLGSFDEECTRFYAAEMVLALEHMHSRNIIHRDLKPENVLLDENMHIKLTDFGTAKMLDKCEKGRNDSFVGTAQYVSPELLTEKNVGKSSDLWSLGCILYQLLAGKVPFRAGNDYQTFRIISNVEYDFPAGFPEKAKDLVKKLLVRDPNARLGCEALGGFASLKVHPFFTGIDWDTLATQTPPKLEAYLPAINPGERGIHATDSAEDELAELEAAMYRREMGEIEVISKQDKQRQEQLAKQAKESPWHCFLNDGELIIKTGLVDKRRGLFSKRRQLVLTDTPRLVYIDPEALEIKGEIPWSSDLTPQFKNMKTFFIHTATRTYYLEDVDRKSIAWVDTINHMLKMQREQKK